MSKNAQVVQLENQSPTTRENKVLYSYGERKIESDDIIIEQPLQITLLWSKAGQECTQVYSITMRTPGDDKSLIVGLLLAEGVISSFEDIYSIVVDRNESHALDAQFDNLWEVKLTQGIIPELSAIERYQMTYSSCGLCGTTSLKSLELKNPAKLDESEAWLMVDDVSLMPDIMQVHQKLFKQTGGSHAAALFDHSGHLLAIKEDIGRHNALDKLFGELAQQTNSKRSRQNHLCVLVSGRISFEIVQKVVMAKVPVLIGVGAPSDLAIKAAKRFDLTLIGFANQSSFNLYHGEWRLKLPAQE